MNVTFLPLDTRVASVDSTMVTVWEKYNHAHIVVYAPAVNGFTVAVKGRAAGVDFPILSTNIVASGTTVMKIGPEYTAGANIAKDTVPYNFYVSVTASGSNTYSIGGSIE